MTPGELNQGNWPYLFELGGDTLESSCNGPAISAALGSDASTAPVLRRDVLEVIAAHESSDGCMNEWDGLCVVRLRDGRYAYLGGGCDTTGWDCQSGGACIVSHELEHLVRFGLGQNERDRLKLHVSRLA